MKKDVFLKRLYCAVLAVLSLYFTWNDLRDIVTGTAFDTGIILNLLCLIHAGHFFLHPEKLTWGQVGHAWRVGMGVLLSLAGGLLCAAYLFFGIKFGCPEEWKMICAAMGFLSVTGFLILPFEREKKEK